MDEKPLDAFLRELSELSAKYGMVLCGFGSDAMDVFQCGYGYIASGLHFVTDNERYVVDVRRD
jgi:hypothetical protein